MAPQTYLSVAFDSLPIFVVLGPDPNLFTLLLVVTDFLVIQVQFKLKNKFLASINKLDSNRLIWVGDIEDNCFIPDGCISKPDIRLRIGLVLEDLHQVLTLL